MQMQHGLPVIVARHSSRNGEHLLPMLSDWLNIQIVGSAESEAEASALVESLGRGWNLLIVDPVLKAGTGLGVVKSVRKQHDQFVLVLGRRVTERMRARCISLGADAVFDESTELNAFMRFCASACLMLNSAAVPRDKNFRRSLLGLVQPDIAPEAVSKDLHQRGSRRWRRAGRAMPWPRATRALAHLPNAPAGKMRIGGAYEQPLQPRAMTVSFVAVEAGGLAASLARQLRDIAYSGQAADLIVATIAALCRALNPSIGKTGVGTMFGRSVRLAALGQPWLQSLQDTVAGAPDLAALKSLLEAQDVQETRKAGSSILRSFSDLLSGMVGLQLSGELLRQAPTHREKAAG
jgi:two-component system, OmpR family, response regulator